MDKRNPFKKIESEQASHPPKRQKTIKSTPSITFSESNEQQYGQNDLFSEDEINHGRNRTNLLSIIWDHKFLAAFITLCFVLSYINVAFLGYRYIEQAAQNNTTAKQLNLNISEHITSLEIITQQQKKQLKTQNSLIIAQAKKLKLSDKAKSNYLPNLYESLSQFGPPSVLKLTKTKQQLEQTIKYMKNPKDRPQKIRNVKKSIEKQDEVYFAFSLSREPLNINFLQAQYYYYNNKYSFDSVDNELPLCIVVTGRNLGDNYHRMLNSLMRQNYTNFHIVLIDDNSQDNTEQNIRKYLQKSEYIKQKITFIQQNQRKFALYNRNLGIRKYCKSGDIVLDVDADDWLIGNQVFKIINALYQDTQLWTCYFNNIIYSHDCKCPLMNSDSVIYKEILEQNRYRVENIWRTTQLRTFRKDLFDKIQESDFIDQNGQFYKWKSDAFMSFPLVQLAGPNHTRFLDQFFYFYDTSFSSPSPGKAYSRLIAKTQTPYQHLSSLKETAEKVQDYKIPQELVKKLQLQKKKLGK